MKRKRRNAKKHANIQLTRVKLEKKPTHYKFPNNNKNNFLVHIIIQFKSKQFEVKTTTVQLFYLFEWTMMSFFHDSYIYRSGIFFVNHYNKNMFP